MAYFFFNETQAIGKGLEAGTTDVTGSLFITLLLVFLLLLTFALALRLPLEWVVIAVLPLLIIQSAYIVQFKALLGLALFFLAFIFVRSLFGR